MFTHSALLWFLPLALLPILLHLLSRWRVKTIELSTFRFLMEGAGHQRRRARLLEWIVLLLRTAFIVLIVFAVSRPVSSTLGNLFSADGSTRHVTLIIDTSASMSLRAGGQSSLERAKAAATALIDRLGPQDLLTLINAGSTSQPRVVFEGHLLEPSRIKTLIETMETGPSHCNIASAMALESPPTPVGGSSETESKDPIIVIITDGQHSTWKSLEAKSPLQILSDNTRATPIILNVGATEPTSNTAIIGESPRGIRPIVGLPVQLTATITTSATHSPRLAGGPKSPADPARDTAPQNPRQAGGYVSTTLSVFLDDRLVDQMSISIAPGTTTTRTITMTPTNAGMIRGKLTLPADALADDDEFLFCLNVQAKLNVLAVIVPPVKDAKPAEQPFIYLDAALSKAPRELGGGANGKLADPSLAGAIELASIHHDILTDAQLASADVVILADAPVDPIRAAMLRRYVEAGGGLLVLPGPRTKRGVINEHLLAGGEPGRDAGVRYDEPVGDPGNEAMFSSIGAVRVTHPILSAFAGHGAQRGERADFFDGVRLFRFYPIHSRGVLAARPLAPTRGEDAAAVTNEVALLSLTDGRPVLVESRAGRGIILLAGFPATPDWSNLPVTGRVFVPLLLRIAEHLRRPSPVSIAPITAPGQAAQLRIADPWRDATAQLTDATGKPHTITLHRDDHERAGLMPPAERRGFYTVDIDPRTPTGQRTRTGFAVNTDARESDVTMIDEAELRSMFGENLRYLRSSADDPQLLAQLNHRREIWRELIWILFAVIGVEFALATLRGRT